MSIPDPRSTLPAAVNWEQNRCRPLTLEMMYGMIGTALTSSNPVLSLLVGDPVQRGINLVFRVVIMLLLPVLILFVVFIIPLIDAGILGAGAAAFITIVFLLLLVGVAFYIRYDVTNTITNLYNPANINLNISGTDMENLAIDMMQNINGGYYSDTLPAVSPCLTMACDGAAAICTSPNPSYVDIPGKRVYFK
jgi:positive regulator of sigma E activity